MITFNVDDGEFEEEDDEEDDDASGNRHSRFKSERFTDSDNNKSESQMRQDSSSSKNNPANSSNKGPRNYDKHKRNRLSTQSIGQYSYLNRPYNPRSAVNYFPRTNPFNSVPPALSHFQPQSRLSLIPGLGPMQPRYGYGQHLTAHQIPGLTSLPSSSTMTPNPLHFGPNHDFLNNKNIYGDKDLQTLDGYHLNDFQSSQRNDNLNPILQKYLKPASFNSSSMPRLAPPYNPRSDSQFVNGFNSAVFGNQATIASALQPLSHLQPFQFMTPSSDIPRQYNSPVQRNISGYQIHPVPPLQRHQVPIDAYKKRERTEPRSNQSTAPESSSDAVDQLIRSNQSAEENSSPKKSIPPKPTNDNLSITSTSINYRPSTKYQVNHNQRFKFDSRNRRQVVSSQFKFKASNSSPTQNITYSKTFMKPKVPQLLKTDRVVKQVEIMDTTPSKVIPSEVVENKGNKVKEPIIVDLEIDEEYKRKLEEQKKLREATIRRKEERRRELIMAKLQKKTPETVPTLACSTDNSEIPPSESDASKEVPDTDVVITSDEKRTVQITGLANTTSDETISKLCRTIGPIEKCTLEQFDSQNRAIVIFQCPKDAAAFQSKYQRHLLDLCVIRVSLV